MRRGDEQFPENGFEAWGGYMQAKIAKLESQLNTKANNDEKESNIFNNVSIFVNGYTEPSSDELKLLMSKHGGIYHIYQRHDDFIIATNLPDTKVRNMPLDKVVKPEWIVDSIKAKKLLNYKNYLLCINNKSQPKLNFTKVFNNPEVVSEYINVTSTASFVSENPLVYSKVVKVDNPNDCIKASHLPKTAADPNFISEFYNNSRLHHISQLGACYKQHINNLRENSTFEFPARDNLCEKINALDKSMCFSEVHFEGGKTIMHIDMDCFFVSVGLRKRPELKGKPIAVTHSKKGQSNQKRDGVDRNAEFNLYKQRQANKLGMSIEDDSNIKIKTRVDAIEDDGDKFGSMSEIASCSYEARQKGCKNGMFMGAALKLCPDLQTIPYDFEGYKEVAFTLYNTIANYTLDIEAVSCDEMYVDCTELLKSIGAGVNEFATVLRDEIKYKTGCPCSCGFGGNRLQARLATKRAKPDGQFFLSTALVEDFMFDIKLQDLPGVGRHTAFKLESLGHQTCGSLQALSLKFLQNNLGQKNGVQLYDQCRGKDPNPLHFTTTRKSVSAEVNYGIRFENNEQCNVFLKQLSLEVHSRMMESKVLGKCITLKLMVRADNAPVETAKFMGHGFCNTINKSTTLGIMTNSIDIITNEVINLWKKQNICPKELRGVGIQVTKLESTSKKNNNQSALTKFLSNSKSDNINSISESLVKEEKNISTKLHKTPTKINILSPKKKSPIISKRSPFKKRGRPPKNLLLQQLPSNSKSLLTKFVIGQSSLKQNDFKHTNELMKIKREISIKPQIQKDLNKPKTDSKGLLGLPWDKIRDLLKAWLHSGQAPLACDVNLIIDYMREMVINKDIDKLSILLRFLKRTVTEINNSEWLDVYNSILIRVQETMLAIYGKKLYI